jgi:hypothetical protein
VPKLDPDELFECTALRCVLRRRVCVRRQVEVERELRGDLAPRSARRKRGLSVEYPACRGCAQGAAVRAELGDACADLVRTGGRSDAGLLTAWAAWLREHPPGDDQILDDLGRLGTLKRRRPRFFE